MDRTRREKRDAKKWPRWKLTMTLLTTYGYGLFGTIVIQTYFVSGTIPSRIQFGGIAVGLALHAMALYIAPLGEADAAH
jgi:polyferredoxin